MDKTVLTIEAFDISAEAFQNKFMDVSSYSNSLEYFLENISNNALILDLGCGPGNVTKFLYEKNKTLKLHGVDLSSEMINFAVQNIPSATFQIADVRFIDFPENHFDGIVLAFCLPFLYNEEAQKVIAAITHCVKESGYIYISTMEGKGYGFEKTSFCKTHDFFFNYFSKDFLENEFLKNCLEINRFFEQPYSNDDGSILNDLIYILRKRENRDGT